MCLDGSPIDENVISLYICTLNNYALGILIKNIGFILRVIKRCFICMKDLVKRIFLSQIQKHNTNVEQISMVTTAFCK